MMKIINQNMEMKYFLLNKILVATDVPPPVLLPPVLLPKISAFNCPPTCSLAATPLPSYLHTVLFFLCSSRTAPRAGATF